MVEKEYIEREAAISKLRLVEVRESHFNFPAGMLCELKSIPAADVVEVVRCKECIYNEDKGNGHFYQWCCQSNKYRPSDWFCADGVREEVVGDV